MKMYEWRAALIRPTTGRDATAIKLDGFAETNRFRQAVSPSTFFQVESFYVISSTMRFMYIFGIRWRTVVSFTTRPPFPLWKASAAPTEQEAGWVGPRVSLDTLRKRQISCPCRESNCSSAVRPET
jgi:hypothetical protein